MVKGCSGPLLYYICRQIHIFKQWLYTYLASIKNHKLTSRYCSLCNLPCGSPSRPQPPALQSFLCHGRQPQPWLRQPTHWSSQCHSRRLEPGPWPPTHWSSPHHVCQLKPRPQLPTGWSSQNHSPRLEYDTDTHGAPNTLAPAADLMVLLTPWPRISFPALAADIMLEPPDLLPIQTPAGVLTSLLDPIYLSHLQPFPYPPAPLPTPSSPPTLRPHLFPPFSSILLPSSPRSGYPLLPHLLPHSHLSSKLHCLLLCPPQPLSPANPLLLSTSPFYLHSQTSPSLLSPPTPSTPYTDPHPNPCLIFTIHSGLPLS
ncbi:uncharacterized protein [Narcine bancroftii]|uniref:uncharacterized protein n=1 Tax=Narcine bancroftii TaxID=1343680 RepID=UPI0038315CBB